MVHELIEGIRRDLGCGVLLISHDLELAMKAGDDMLVLVPHEHDDPPRAGGAPPGAGSGGGHGDGLFHH